MSIFILRSTVLLLLLLFFPAAMLAQSPGTKQIIIKIESKNRSLSKSASATLETLSPDTKNVLQSLNIPQLRQFFDIPFSLNKANNVVLLQNYYTLEVNKSQLPTVLRLLRNDAAVIYADTVRTFQIEFFEEDSLLAQQTALNQINAIDAWAVETGKNDILIGVIDTGIDYTHPDLNNQLWINVPEDINGNGRLDSLDMNGIDEDGNGYIDDVIGWDFTDAPAFPDAGDFIGEDPDPLDEHGHGTAMSGIIAAERNNRIGISGVAPGTRIMTLRAGTSRGFLEEDDVARAIIYAVHNNAKIISMSFGDTDFSLLFRDIIQYASRNGCILVSSTGNKGGAFPHFPSGFPETIAVGSVTGNNALSGFSNFGNTVDLVAPGQSVLTTRIGGEYSRVNGTSISTAIVSGVLGLVVSRFPGITPNEARSIITSTAIDAGNPGWDPFYGAGVVNVLASVNGTRNLNANLSADIFEDADNQLHLALTGSVFGDNFSSYSLYYSLGEDSENWTPLAIDKNSQVSNDTLGVFMLPVIHDTVLVARMEVRDINNLVTERRSRILVNRTAPEISNLETIEMWEENNLGLHVSFTSSVQSIGTLFYKQSGEMNFRQVREDGAGLEHSFFVKSKSISQTVEWHVEVSTEFGKKTVFDNNGIGFTDTLQGFATPKADLTVFPENLPAGILFSETTDFDEDGRREVMITERSADQSFGDIVIYEAAGNNMFAKLNFTTPLPNAIIRDVGDIDGNGLSEFLIGSGDITHLLEQPASQELPEELIWTSERDFWGSTVYDIENDMKPEIFAHNKGVWGVYSFNDGDVQLAAEFINPTSGTNALGVPHIEIGDFDGDSNIEVLYGDFDGDLIVYELQNGVWQNTWSASLGGIDAIDFIGSGSFTTVGETQFFGATRFQDAAASGASSGGFWKMVVFEKTSNNNFSPVDSIFVSGTLSPIDFESSTLSADINANGINEVYLSFYPDLYVFEYNTMLRKFDLLWYNSMSKSSRMLVDNVLGSGSKEFLYDTGNGIKVLQHNGLVDQPGIPKGFIVQPLDTASIRLRWDYDEDFDTFSIYRNTSPTNLKKIADTVEKEFIDTDVQNGVRYWYAVTAVKGVQESPRDFFADATPNEKPFLANVNFIEPNALLIEFSENMGKNALITSNYSITPDLDFSSAIFKPGNNKVLLTASKRRLPPGVFTMTAGVAIADIQKTPIDIQKNSVIFTVGESEKPLIISEVKQTGTKEVQVEYSVEVDSSSATEISNYTFGEGFSVANVSLVDPKTVKLGLESTEPVGALGKSYRILVKKLFSKSKEQLVFDLSFTLSLTNDDLEKAFVYPNPARQSNTNDVMTFANLPSEATIYILDIRGRLITTLREDNADGGMSWNMRDESGNALSSGIYFYIISAGGNSVKKKFTIIR